MCATCGCDDIEHVHADEHEHEHAHEHDHAHEHGHAHEHSHAHEHPHPHAHPKTVLLEHDVLAKNDRLASYNRALFTSHRIAAFNFTSSPGSGKTALLEALIARLRSRVRLAVIEGDQETERDADRIRAAGAPVVQVNTATGCHLDARMVRNAVEALDPAAGTLLLIENVGNLVCPALFDLGERAKVVVMSVTEGEDKPLKYPHMFRAAKVLVLTKTDLLPHLEFDVARCLENARRVNPSLRVFELSVRDGSGVGAFCDFIAAEIPAARA